MSDQRAPRNTTGVGGLVVRDNQILTVQMTYGPSQGRYMLPGGLLDPGETLDCAVVREVWEETGIIARPQGIISVRSFYSPRGTDTYLIWLMEHESGEPVPDGREVADVKFFDQQELEDRDDIVYLVRYMARQYFSGKLQPMSMVEDYEYMMPGATPDSWKLFR